MRPRLIAVALLFGVAPAMALSGNELRGEWIQVGGDMSFRVDYSTARRGWLWADSLEGYSFIGGESYNFGNIRVRNIHDYSCTYDLKFIRDDELEITPTGGTGGNACLHGYFKKAR